MARRKPITHYNRSVFNRTFPTAANQSKNSLYQATQAQRQGASNATAGEMLEAVEKVQDPLLAQAIDQAKLGDDTFLLPYQPTPSINPPRPRTLAAGYDRQTRTLRIRFRDGAVYVYQDVPERVWRNFKRVKSPGRMVNRVLNNYNYYREPWA